MECRGGSCLILSMNYVTVTAPHAFNPCSILLPPSKSVANRMLTLAALCGIKPQSVLQGSLDDLCDDIRVLAQLVQSSDELVDVGAAGTAMRFGTAYLSVTSGKHIITGTPRLQSRPIGLLVDALRQLGADIQYIGNEGYPPLCINGNPSMSGGRVRLKGNVSSQFISALLMIAPTLDGGLTLCLEGEVVSRPYIDLTIGLMQRFGADVRWADANTIMVEATGLTPPQSPDIEADWTAASYWYEIATLGKTDAIAFGSQLNHDSMQGDKVCDEIFKAINNSTALFCYDFTLCPDLAQTIVVTCCMMRRRFRFTGLQTLRIKETDRIEALRVELEKLGYVLHTTDSTIEWDGTTTPAAALPLIGTYNDHRMAMAFAPCAITLGSIRIADPGVVTKSYPTFWRHLQQAGFNLSYNK